MSTTSPASRRRPSSGSSLLTVLLTLLFAGFSPPEGHVVQRLEEGHIDWTARTVHVLGVGTPKILSPTGGVTPDDPYAMARRDAQRRLERVVARLPLDGQRRLRDAAELDDARAARLKTFTAASATYFSDGTVHLPAWVDLAWVAPAMTGAEGTPPEPEQSPPATGPTGLIVHVTGAVDPAFRLTVHGPAGGSLSGGLPGDSIGDDGVYWVTSTEQAVELAGARPHVVQATAHAEQGAGSVKVTDPAFWEIVKAGVPGRIAVVVKK